jgi:hypothetical protein
VLTVSVEEGESNRAHLANRMKLVSSNSNDVSTVARSTTGTEPRALGPWWHSVKRRIVLCSLCRSSIEKIVFGMMLCAYQLV